MNKILKFDKMDLKKKCLDSWKIPCINYDPKMLLSNKFNKPKDILSLEKLSNKPKTLKEQAYIFSDYDKNSESMQSFLDILDKGSKNVIKFDDRKRKDYEFKGLEDKFNKEEKDDKAAFEKLFGKKGFNKNKNTKDKKQERDNRKDFSNKYSSYSCIFLYYNIIISF